jgi:clan AA aspartic protease
MKYDYELINETLHPVIGGTLISPSREEELTMIVDTGFEGHLLIPSRLYKELGFIKYEHPISDFPVLETVSGMAIKIRSAPAQLYIKNLKMDIDVWTMPDCNEILLGLLALNELVLKLNGPEKILEILKMKSFKNK